MLSNDNDDEVSISPPHNDVNDVVVLLVGKVVDDTGDDERKDDTPTHSELEYDILLIAEVVVVVVYR
jgi:hypothetical protein